MRHRRCQRGATAMLTACVALLLVYGGSGALLAEPFASSANLALELGDVRPNESLPDDPLPLHTPEELRQRIQGMEGKLRESANARKNADQARMEAERHLAEGMQRIEQLQLASDDLANQLAAREAEVARLVNELSAARQTHAELNRRLAELQSRLPVLDGGSLTAEDARRSAAEALAALHAATTDTDDPSRESSATLAEAENLLHRRQLRLASVIDAHSVYRVRPNDTLAAISGRFYGSAQQWRTLFEANRHVIDDPDRLVSGITLVIP